MDTRLQRLGGIVALAGILAIVGQLLFFGVYLPGIGFSVNDMSGSVQAQYHLITTPAARIGFLTDALVLFVYFSFTFVTVHALYMRLRASAPTLSLLAAVFGYATSGLLVMEQVRLYWLARAVGISVSPDKFAIIGPVFDALRGVIENGSFLFGIPWVFLVSAAALRNRELPRPIAYLGLAAPLILVVAFFFGPILLGTLWLVAVGVVLVLRPDPMATRSPHGASETASAEPSV